MYCARVSFAIGPGGRQLRAVLREFELVAWLCGEFDALFLERCNHVAH